MIPLNILISDLTSMINKYEACRELANNFGKVIILKNEQPDTVLLPIDEYERLLDAFEKSDHISRLSVVDIVGQLPPAGNRQVYTLAQLRNDLHSRNKKSSRRISE